MPVDRGAPQVALFPLGMGSIAQDLPRASAATGGKINTEGTEVAEAPWRAKHEAAITLRSVSSVVNPFPLGMGSIVRNSADRRLTQKAIALNCEFSC
jgi:hypothetical protein